jgi:hypothetical protein
MPDNPDWPLPIWTPDPALARVHMPEILKAFGPIEAIVESVGPDWGAVSEPDLFDQPTRSQEVARYIEHRIYGTGLLYWRTFHLPSVAETHDLLAQLEARLAGVARIMRRRLMHVRNAFNAPFGPTYEEVPDHDAWQHLDDAIEDAFARITRLQLPDVNVGDLLEQPATRRKESDRVMWEAIFTLLRECGIDPLEKYQPLIHTLRAAHRLFGIHELPNPGHVGYVKSEFRKQQKASMPSKTLGKGGK